MKNFAVVDKNNILNIPTVEELINAVEESGCVGSSTRQRDLIEYLLLNAVKNDDTVIKGYTIAIDVLGRSEDFDPETDSIVRVEMHRLRKNLKLFNATEYPFSIHLEKGSYSPIIRQKKIAPRRSFRLANISIIFFTWAGLLTIFLGNSILTRDNKLECPGPNSTVLLSTQFQDEPSKAFQDRLVSNLILSTMGDNIVDIRANIPYHCKSSNTYDLNFKTLASRATSESSELHEIAGALYHRDSRQLIWSKTYDAKSANNATLMILEDLFTANGQLFSDVQTRIWPDTDQHYRIRLYIAVQNYLSLSPSEQNKLEAQLLEEHSKHSNDPITLEALAYLYEIKYFFQEPKTEYLELKQSYISQLSKISPDHIYVLTNALELEKQRTPINTFKLKDIIHKLQTLYPHKTNTHTHITFATGFNLGDWDQAVAQLSASRLELNEYDTANYIYVAKAIIDEDWNRAKRYSYKIPQSNIAEIFKLKIAMELGEDNNVIESLNYFRKEQNISLDEVQQLLLSRNYHSSLHDPLYKALGSAKDLPYIYGEDNK